MQLWRVCRKKYAATPLDGEGALRHGGRWNSPGSRVAYACDSLASSMLEVIVWANAPEILALPHVYFRIDVDEKRISELPAGALPADWLTNEHATRKIGDHWIAGQESPVLRVPSAIVPVGYNFLINPAHRDFNKLTISPPIDLDFDKRLIK